MTPEILAVRRYVSRRHTRIPWGQVVRTAGGRDRLSAYLDADGQVDPDLLEPLLTRIYWVRVGKGHMRP